MSRALVTPLAALAVCVLTLPGAVGARVVQLQAGADRLSVELIESSPERTVIRYELGSFATAPVEVGGETWHTVDLGDESHILERGLPDLPNVCRSVAIPDDAEMSVRVVSSHYVEFHDIGVVPSKGSIERTLDPAAVAYEFSPFYSMDAWYPAELAYARDPYIMRDVRGMVVVVNPFRYNPAERVLRVYDSVVVEITRVRPGKINVLRRRPPTGLDREFARIYETHFLNYENAPSLRYAPVEEVGNMLVISYGSFMTAMEPFVEWKRQTGVPCEMVSVATAGGTPAAIKSYIQNYYDTNGLTFVLLVGDGDQVPTPYVNGGASDPSYSLVAGDDTYPDIFVGRFSAETVGQVETQVERTVEYEKAPQAGADWYHRGIGIASNQGPGDDGEDDDEHMDFIRDDLLAFTYTDVDRVYDPGASPDMVSTPLNEGRGIINYTGHGSSMGWASSDFTSNHVNALVNDNMLPFIWSVACVNGMFDGLTCFAEAWMRATNGGEPTGAVGTLMSSINQDWDEPMDAQDEMVDLLAVGAKRTFGGLSMNGCCHMLDEYGFDGDDDFLSWHIFGDPSLRVRTDSPVELDVVHSESVSPLASTFEVTVDGVEGAMCALYYDGVLYGSGLTDAGGTVVIDIVDPLPGNEDVLVTVTSFNAMPYEGTVHVGQAYTPVIDVSPSSLSADLAPGGQSSGSLTIENVGEPQSVLEYYIEITDSGVVRTHDGSGVTVQPTSCEPGSTLDLVFSVTNAAADGEWLEGAGLRFPDGVVVNSSTDLVVGERTLSFVGATGGGAHVRWEGDWWNVVYPGETAHATVNVTVDGGFYGNVDIIFGLRGDGYGERPHSLSGAVTVECGTAPLLTLISPNGDEVWGVGEVHDITWSPSGQPLLVDILCSGDGGASWTTVAAGTDDDGEYSWTVNSAASDNCLLEVRLSVDDAVSDVSDASFSIYEPVDWLSVSPASGEVPMGSAASVGVGFDASDMTEGEYFADLVVTSNGGSPVVVPVTLRVAPTGVDDRVPSVPKIYGGYPNPFNPDTRIAFSIPRTTHVRLSLYSVGGRFVRTLADDVFGPGRHTVLWDGTSQAGRELPSGVYFYMLEAGGEPLSGSIVLLR